MTTMTMQRQQQPERSQATSSSCGANGTAFTAACHRSHCSRSPSSPLRSSRFLGASTTLATPSAYSSSSSFFSYPSSSSFASTSSSSSSPLSSSSSSSSSSSPSPSSCPTLLSVLAWSATLLLVSSCLGIADAGVLMGHPLGKRSYLDISCKGVYDKSIFARLDRICEDCYNLFREPQLHVLCRKNCFTTDYFKGCLDVLLLTDEMEKIQMWIKQLHGADPGV